MFCLIEARNGSFYVELKSGEGCLLRAFEGDLGPPSMSTILSFGELGKMQSVRNGQNLNKSVWSMLYGVPTDLASLVSEQKTAFPPLDNAVFSRHLATCPDGSRPGIFLYNIPKVPDLSGWQLYHGPNRQPWLTPSLLAELLHAVFVFPEDCSITLLPCSAKVLPTR